MIEPLDPVAQKSLLQLDRQPTSKRIPAEPSLAETLSTQKAAPLSNTLLSKTSLEMFESVVPDYFLQLIIKLIIKDGELE